MDAQDMVLGDITRKQLIWYGHVERREPKRLSKSLIYWKPEGRKKRGRPRRTLERWNIYSHEWKRYKNGRMEESKAMEYESWKASSDVLKLRFIYTGCPRRKGPNFGRVFRRSNYTDITQNTYIQNSMVTEILAREKCGLLWCLRIVLCP
jgi:hypothetical protein